MSTDKINAVILEEFVKKTRLAIKSGQKEIKISTSEAENVVHNLTLLILKTLEKDDNLKKDNEVISVVMDGGGFEEKR